MCTLRSQPLAESAEAPARPVGAVEAVGQSTHARARARTQPPACTHACTSTHTHARTRTHAQARAHTHPHARTYTCALAQPTEGEVSTVSSPSSTTGSPAFSASKGRQGRLRTCVGVGARRGVGVSACACVYACVGECTHARECPLKEMRTFDVCMTCCCNSPTLAGSQVGLRPPLHGGPDV